MSPRPKRRLERKIDELEDIILHLRTVCNNKDNSIAKLRRGIAQQKEYIRELNDEICERDELAQDLVRGWPAKLSGATARFGAKVEDQPMEDPPAAPEELSRSQGESDGMAKPEDNPRGRRSPPQSPAHIKDNSSEQYSYVREHRQEWAAQSSPSARVAVDAAREQHPFGSTGPRSPPCVTTSESPRKAADRAELTTPSTSEGSSRHSSQTMRGPCQPPDGDEGVCVDVRVNLP